MLAARPKKATQMERVLEQETGRATLTRADYNASLLRMMTYEDLRAAMDESPKSQGMNTVIVLDTSGSMAGQPFIEAINFITEFIKGLEDIKAEHSLNENVALAIFGKKTRVVQHLTSDYTLIRQAIAGLVAAGPCCLDIGLLLPHCVLSKQTYKDHIVRGIYVINGHVIPPRVILITKGQVSNTVNLVDTDKRHIMMKDICNYIETQLRELTLHRSYCVSVGDVDEDLLKFIGSKMVSSKDGQKMSRLFLYHKIVADLKEGCEGIPDLSVIDIRVREVLTCCDNEDVASVREIMLQEEIDLQKADDILRK